MLLNKAALESIRQGRQHLVFRTWRRATVKSGGNLMTEIGVLKIDSVEVVNPAELTDDDAMGAGYAGVPQLLEAISGPFEGDLYRIRLHFAGPDPRSELREDTALSPHDIERLRAELARMDRRSAAGPWTLRVLRGIQNHPSLPAAELADFLGFEKEWLKTNVCKLKNMGLTVSLKPGYMLSPRGETLLMRL